MKRTKNIIIITLLIVISVMAVGYSAFATQLSVNGTAEIIGEWDVKIVGVEAQDISEGCEAGTPQYTNTSVTFDAKLVKPGDSISYKVTIENAGTIDATLGTVIFKESDGSPAINYITTELQQSLKAGETTRIVEYVQI